MPVAASAPAETPARRAATLLLSAAVLLCAVWAVAPPTFLSQVTNDFIHFYTGATLAGGPDLYSAAKRVALQKELTGREHEALLHVRLPVYYLLLKPLTALPLPAAHIAFQGLTVAIFGAFVAAMSRSVPSLPVLAALSMPVITNVLRAQDAIVVAALAGFGALLASKNRDAQAGCLFGLCAIKPHLFLLLPVAVVLYRRWSILQTAGATVAALLVGSFAGGGAHWPARMLEAVRDPAAHPDKNLMVSVHGLVSTFGWPGWTEWGLAALAAVLAVRAMRRVGSFEGAVGVVLVAGPLLAVHAYIQDASTVVAGSALLIARGLPRLTQAVLVLALLPPAYYLMLDGAPASGLIHLILFTALALLAR